MDLKNRLNSIIEKDKKTNPQYLNNVIKSDFFYLISNYFEVNFEDISVDINVEGSCYSIEIKTIGERMKTMKTLPN